MKKHHFLNFGLILIFCFTITNQSLKAQQTVPCNSVHWLYLQIKQNATFPQFCQCVDFIHACTGKPAIIKGQVHNRCGNGPKYCYEVNGSTVCNTLMCELGNTRMAIHADNWDVCGQIDQDPCKVLVSQYLPLNPAFNGQLIGNWPFFSSASYPLNLNEPSGAEVFNFCPGENAVLTFPGMEIPKESGLCLVVNILSGTGAIIASQTYDYSDINNSEVNITDLMATLTPGTYQYEFILRCCDQEKVLCVFNNSNKYTKKAWFKIEGEEMEFTAHLVQGGGFGCNPQINSPLIASFPGPRYESYSDCGQINMNIFNITNPGSNNVQISVYELNDCDPFGQETFVGSITETPPHGESTTFPFIPVQQSFPDCKCYRVELEYENCGTINVERYYYRVNGTANNCPENLGGFDGSNFLISPDLDGTSASAFPNPATNEIYFSIQDEVDSYPDHLDLTILDQSGKVLMKTQLNFYNHLSEKISLDLPQGMYIYVLKSADLNLNGKFIIKE